MLNVTQNAPGIEIPMPPSPFLSGPETVEAFARRFLRHFRTLPGAAPRHESRKLVMALVNLLCFVDTYAPHKFPAIRFVNAPRVVPGLSKWCASLGQSFVETQRFQFTLCEQIDLVMCLYVVAREGLAQSLYCRSGAVLAGIGIGPLAEATSGLNYTSGRAAHSELQRELRVAGLDETCPECCPEPVPL
jgi:hypothetical protein